MSGTLEKVREIVAKRSSPPGDRRSVDEAKHDLRRRLSDGEEMPCPVCGQFCKMYRRNLNSAMAMVLVYMERYFRHPGADHWLHIENHLKGIKDAPPALRGDFPKLRHWGLIEMKDGAREDSSKRVGYYRITAKGVDFVKGKIRVPKHIFMYDNEVLSFGTEDTDIREALGERFSFAELMLPAKEKA